MKKPAQKKDLKDLASKMEGSPKPKKAGPPSGIYQKLSRPLPAGSFQATVDRLNEVLGIDGWGYKDKVIDEKKSRLKTGGAVYEITVAVGIWIQDEKNIRIVPCGEIGGIYQDVVSKAFEGAFMKAAAMFGVGKELSLSEGSEIDRDDIVPEPEPPETVAPVAPPAPVAPRTKMSASERAAAVKEPEEVDPKTESKIMAAEDGVPPGMPKVPPELPQNPMTAVQRTKIMRLAQFLNRDPAGWMTQPRTGVEAEAMLITLSNLAGPDADLIAGGTPTTL